MPTGSDKTKPSRNRKLKQVKPHKEPMPPNNLNSFSDSRTGHVYNTKQESPGTEKGRRIKADPREVELELELSSEQRPEDEKVRPERAAHLGGCRKGRRR